MIIIRLSILLLFIVIALQDFKQRAIHWVLFPMLMFFLVYESLSLISLKDLINNVLFNMGFVILQMLLLFVFLIARGRSFGNIIDNEIGLGDLVLLITLAFGFSRVNFIVGYILALLFSLILWVIISKIIKTQERVLPLAGFVSIACFLLFTFDFLFSFYNRFDDSFLISHLYG